MKAYNVILLSILCLYLIKCGKNNQVSTKFRSIACQADNFTAVIVYCYIKAVRMKLLKVLDKTFYVQLILFYRYGLIYRKVIDTKVIEWCSVMDVRKYN